MLYKVEFFQIKLTCLCSNRFSSSFFHCCRKENSGSNLTPSLIILEYLGSGLKKYNLSHQCAQVFSVLSIS